MATGVERASTPRRRTGPTWAISSRTSRRSRKRSTARRSEQVREIRTAQSIKDDDAVFGRVVYGFGREDLADPVLGALLFGFPVFVESGTQEVGSFVARHPAYLALTLGLAVWLVISILHVADIQNVRVRNAIIGLVPQARRRAGRVVHHRVRDDDGREPRRLADALARALSVHGRVRAAGDRCRARGRPPGDLIGPGRTTPPRGPGRDAVAHSPAAVV